MTSSKGWSIFTLLIAFVGLGFSGYTYFFVLPQLSQQQQFGIQNTWYDTYSSSVDVNTFDTIIPDLSVVVTVNPGESLYVLYNTDAFYESGAGIEFLNVYLRLNNYKISTPSASFGTQTAVKMWIELILPYTNFTISSGVYNISLIANAPGSTASKSLYDMTLFAYTFR